MLGARFVVAVDTHLTASFRAADVVLPAATWAERRGTFTNLEDRITWLSQLVTARGVAWPDWVIASELAARLGVDLGFLEPRGHLGRDHPGVAASSGRHLRGSGRVERPGRAGGAHGIGTAAAIPVPEPATPRPHGRPRDLVGRAAHGGPHGHAARGRLDGARTRRHRVAGWSASSTGGPAGPDRGLSRRRPAEPAAPETPAPDCRPGWPCRLAAGPGHGPRDARLATPTALRLVARRTLWDGGTQVQAVPALAGLHPAARVVVHPSVLAALGTAEGERSGSARNGARWSLPAVGDPALPRRNGAAAWNLPGCHAADLIDASAPFTEVVVAPEGRQDADG